MDKYTLPNIKDLQRLYEEKGHDVLVWYAWRNVLRILPILGHIPLNTVWAKNTIIHIYAIIRVALGLQQWHSLSQLTSTSNNANAISIAANDTGRIAAYAAYGVVAYAAADAVSTAATPDESAVTAASAADNSTDDDMAVYTTRAYAAAISDYNYLKNENNFSWFSRPIWSRNGFGSSKPKEYKQWEINLVNDLNALGLDFLSNDLKAVWENRPLGAYAKNYFLDLSESVIGDPKALRRAILYGEITEQVKAVRVLLLGSGGAGKTSLANRLKGNNQSIQVPVTIGVDYQQHQALKLHETLPELKLESNDLDLYLWDFGGQTIFHGLHRAFLHENCVYVLVVDNRHEQAPEEWLHQICHLAGTQAKLLLVTNEYENCHSRQNETRLIREFEGLLDKDSFFYFPCKKPEDESTDQARSFEYFVKALIKASEDSRKSVFASTLAVQRKLIKEYENEVFLHENYVLDLIEKETKEIDAALNQLKQLGFLISLKSDSLQYCLKPAWAVDNTYQVLYAESIRTNNGLAGMRDINKILSQQVKSEHTEYLTDFLKERSLCCFLPNKQFFFPDAATANEPALVHELLNYLTNVTLRFDLPYLPLGFHTRLVHQLFNDQTTSIKDIKHVWRQGFILSTHGSQAIVQYHLRKASIEVVLVGRVEQFAELFQTFYSALKQAVISEKSLIENQINLAVLFNEKPFAVHSSDDFLAALKSVHSFKDFAEEMNKLNQNIHINAANNNQIIIGNNSTQKQGSDNHTQR